MKRLFSLWFIILNLLSLPLSAEEKAEIPADLLDDPHIREELGVNEMTAPSIEKIFATLTEIGTLKPDTVKRTVAERMPLDRTQIAMEIGFLMSEGFLAVQSGQTNRIEPLARQLQRYGRALGAGDRLERHVASLLDSAKAGDVAKLKEELTKTQRDVEAELVALKDSDLAHLISLGGWIRALEVATVSVSANFSEKRAKPLFREDIADYYSVTIGGLHPSISERKNMMAIRLLLSGLRTSLVLKANEKPTTAHLDDLKKVSEKLVTLVLERPE